MERRLLSGNEALARGAWEGGVRVAFGYPGTPSTEILENLSKYGDVYCEWSPNEKVALEAAAGASIGGARSLVTMKLVGLNVAADPLMTLSYIGVVGGMVIVVADDPGQSSSQTEQDTRHYARLAKVPVLEPASAVECLEFVKRGFELSEEHGCPVILRTTTCVSHSRFLCSLGGRGIAKDANFERNPTRFCPLPIWGRKLRRDVEDRMVRQSLASDTSPLNKEYVRGTGLGIVTASVCGLHCLDVFPEASVLKLGWSWPFPDQLLKDFASRMDRVVVIEEGDPILEEHVKSLGISCVGKEVVPRCGELTPMVLRGVKARLEGREPEVVPPVADAADLPGRPPMLCAGCPHRGIFYGLTKYDVVVTGDIGCYSLGVFPAAVTDGCAFVHGWRLHVGAWVVPGGREASRGRHRRRFHVFPFGHNGFAQHGVQSREGGADCRGQQDDGDDGSPGASGNWAYVDGRGDERGVDRGDCRGLRGQADQGRQSLRFGGG
jgi:indolepyruvate ferredoxin oxidoreductase alpha subunit